MSESNDLEDKLDEAIRGVEKIKKEKESAKRLRFYVEFAKTQDITKWKRPVYVIHEHELFGGRLHWDLRFEEWMDQIKNVSTDSRKKSLVETSLDIFLGFMMFLPVNYFVLPLFAEMIAEHSLLAAIQIGIMFSAISLVRKFTIRRWFERMRAEPRFV